MTLKIETIGTCSLCNKKATHRVKHFGLFHNFDIYVCVDHRDEITDTWLERRKWF